MIIRLLYRVYDCRDMLAQPYLVLRLRPILFWSTLFLTLFSCFFDQVKKNHVFVPFAQIVLAYMKNLLKLAVYVLAASSSSAAPNANADPHKLENLEQYPVEIQQYFRLQSDFMAKKKEKKFATGSSSPLTGVSKSGAKSGSQSNPGVRLLT